jgi:hypothetical protein
VSVIKERDIYTLYYGKDPDTFFGKCEPPNIHTKPYLGKAVYLILKWKKKKFSKIQADK